MRLQPRSWEDLTSRQRRAIVAGGLVSTLLQLWMLWDLWRRPAEQVRGSKRAWVAASFVRPVGQLAYLWWGRRAEPPPLPRLVPDPADAPAR